MAKQVKVAQEYGFKINDADLAVLRFVASPKKNTGKLSQSAIAGQLDIQKATVHRCMRKLNELELIEIQECYLPNGGQLENEYVLTSSGQQLLYHLSLE